MNSQLLSSVWRKRRTITETVFHIAVFAMATMALIFLTGCDEGMNMAGDIIMEPGETPNLAMNGEVKQPDPTVDDEPEQPEKEDDSTEKDEPPSEGEKDNNNEMEKPELEDPVETVDPVDPLDSDLTASITINSVVQADEGSVVISGVSDGLSEGATITVTFNETIAFTDTVDSIGRWKIAIPPAELEQLTVGTVTVTVTAPQADPDTASFEYKMIVTDTPAWLIPPPDAVLSDLERSLMESHQLINYDAVTRSMTALPTGKSVDQISTLPYKDREEVYEQFIQAIELELPFFREAAEHMKEADINLIVLGNTKGTNNPEYLAYREKTYEKEGLNMITLKDLRDIYFEEKPEDRQYIGNTYRGAHSHYWMILEYYRLQLEHQNLAERLRSRKAGAAFEILELFRKSAQKGYVFGLDNPWN